MMTEILFAGCVLLAGIIGVSPADDGKGGSINQALAIQGGLSTGSRAAENTNRH